MSRGCLKDTSRSASVSHKPQILTHKKTKKWVINSPPVPFSHQVNMLVIELKSEALKDRHWKQLMKRLHVNWVPSELTLGQIWDVDLQKNEMVVKDVLLVAQGEMALEEFLKQVKSKTLERLCSVVEMLHSFHSSWFKFTVACRPFNNNSVVFGLQIREVWNSYELDLVNYQNKCRLIRGWDDLFNKVKEHINSVSAMKLSPYYKVNRMTCCVLHKYLSFENFINTMLFLFLSPRCLRKTPWAGRTSWIASWLCLMFGLMSSVAGSIWKASLPAALTSNISCL